MAAQYDVNLEKCALLKCLCGSAFAARQAPVRSLALKISVIFGHTSLHFTLFIEHFTTAPADQSAVQSRNTH